MKCLRDKIEALEDTLDFGRELDIHAGIAHTRWATHGVPSNINSHPHRSDESNEFIVVHNGECMSACVWGVGWGGLKKELLKTNVCLNHFK